MTLGTIAAEPPPAMPALADIQRRHAELLARRAQHQPEEETQSGSRDARASQGSRWSSSLRWASPPATRHLGGDALRPFGHRSKLRLPYRSNFPRFPRTISVGLNSSVAGAGSMPPTSSSRRACGPDGQFCDSISITRAFGRYGLGMIMQSHAAALSIADHLLLCRL